ncbi:hypothetical protein D3C72_1473210 [compost metagenome]
MQHLVVEGFRKADAQLAEEQVGHAARLALEGLDGAEQLSRGGQHLLALGRQAKAGLAAFAQAKTQARLQFGHLRADGGLAHPQLALGRAEPAAFHHADEKPQQLDVEVMELAEHGGTKH